MQHKYKVLYADFHTNIHPEQMDQLEKWYNHARKVTDFWLIAYYPFQKYEYGKGLKSESEIPKAEYLKQWQDVRDFVKKVNKDNPEFPMFLGYEWHGAGLDGDHNVFFKQDGEMTMPLRYVDLVEYYKGQDVVGIPHHVAYQKGHRGKNWDTHNNEFSPFVEIKSQHGSSEYATTDMAMDRHVHMGPRTGKTTVFDGLNEGHKVGIIAAGDNHVVPADQINGLAGVWAKSNSKDDIWDAMLNKRVYGFSKNRIQLWMDVEGSPMGSTIKSSDTNQKVNVEVVGNSKVRTIELIHNGQLEDIYIHKADKASDKFKFKSKFEFGWGPNPVTYPSITNRDWHIVLESEAKIVNYEPSYSNFEHEVLYKDDHKMEFEMTTYKTSHAGKWMGKAPIVAEGYIFEFEGSPSDKIWLTINGKKYEKTVSEILENTDLIVELEESYEIAKKHFDVTENYRSDPFYHNAYKTRINEGFSENQYTVETEFEIKKEDQNGWYIVKVYQQDGQVAWSSPIWFE